MCKFAVVLVVLLSTWSTMSWAHDEPPVPVVIADPATQQKFVKYFTNMRAILALSDTQIKQVRPIVALDIKKKVKVFRCYGFVNGEKPDLSFWQKYKLKSKINDINDNTLDMLDSILNEGQAKLYRSYVKQVRDSLRPD